MKNILGEGPLPLGSLDTLDESLQVIEVAYHIPFDGGILQVSEAADEAYNLVPLVTGVEEGPPDDIVTEKESPFALLTLRSPSEAPLLPAEQIPPQADTVLAASEVEIYQNLIHLQIFFSTSATDFIDRNIAAIIRSAGKDSAFPVSEEDLPGGANGESLREYLKNQIPQQYAHILTHTLEGDLIKAHDHYSRITAANRAYKLQRDLGWLSFGAASGMVLSSSLVAGRLSIPSLFMAGGYTAYTQWHRNKQLRSYINEDAQRANGPSALSRSYASRVSDVIHDTFCAGHFAEQMEGSLNDPEVGS